MTEYAEAMNKSHVYKGMLSEVNKLLKFYLTFPVTTATAEWSFSSLWRIKDLPKEHNDRLQIKQHIFKSPLEQMH